MVITVNMSMVNNNKIVLFYVDDEQIYWIIEIFKFKKDICINLDGNKDITNEKLEFKFCSLDYCNFKLEEMKDFVGCFLTGTAAEVTPVSEINEYKFKICEVVTDLNESYQALVRKKTAA